MERTKCSNCNRINQCWFQKSQQMISSEECLPPYDLIKEFRMSKEQTRFKITSFRTRFGYAELFVEDTKILDELGLPLVIGQFRTLPEAIKFVDSKLIPTINE